MTERRRKNVKTALILLAATVAVTVAVVLTGGDDILVAVLLGLIAAELLVIGRITDPGPDGTALQTHREVAETDDVVDRPRLT